MTITDPGNPDTSSYAVRKLMDGSPMDAEGGTFGVAVHYERVSVADPAPDHAQKLADNLLNTLGGSVATLQIRCIPQPWIQPGDVLWLDFQGSKAVIQVASWQMDLGDRSEMTITARAWRVRSEAMTGEHWPPRQPFEISANTGLPVDAPTPDPVVVAPPDYTPYGQYSNQYSTQFNSLNNPDPNAGTP